MIERARTRMLRIEGKRLRRDLQHLEEERREEMPTTLGGEKRRGDAQKATFSFLSMIYLNCCTRMT